MSASSSSHSLECVESLELKCDQSSSRAGAAAAEHTSAYVSIRQNTSAYVSIRQHTSVLLAGWSCCCDAADAEVYCQRRIMRHTSAYVSIRQHTSAYVSIRQHTSAVKDDGSLPLSQYLYFCTSKASKLSTCDRISIHQHATQSVFVLLY